MNPNLVFLTIVLADVLIAPGDLHTFDPRAFKDRIAHLLDRAGLGYLPAVGGIDFALTFWRAQGLTYWQPHLHAIIWCPMGVIAAETMLQQHAKISELVDRTIDLRPITGTLSKLIGYTLKSIFWKRLPYISEKTGNHCADQERLPIWATRELAMYLDSIRIESRQFRKNVEWHDGRLRTSAEALAWCREYRSDDR